MGGFAIQIGFSSARRDIQPLYVGIVITLLGALIVFLTSLGIVQRITRPLVLAAERVEGFRGGENFEPLPEHGPRELVSLARSFNTMAREISSLLSNRTTLLAGISHDLRTPLTRMRLALALLPPEVDARLIERFERNLEVMDGLIGDALQFARGAQETPQEIELVAFIRDTLSGFDQPVPLSADPPQDVRVAVAPGALQRVLVNIVGNGLQHASDVRVHVAGRRIEISDRGPGIPAALREAVFQPFYRLDSSRNVHTGGSGLGLAIVRQLCQAQGWRVRIEDAVGGGACFVIEL